MTALSPLWQSLNSREAQRILARIGKMDHLHVPIGSDLPPIEVPFICANEPVCDKFYFFHWPKQQGLENNDPQRSFAARAQSWLYFGLLAAFLDEDFEREELTKLNSSGHRIVDSTSLVQRILDWKKMLQPNKNTTGDLVTPQDQASIQAAERCRSTEIVECAILAMNQQVITALNSMEATPDANIWNSETHAIIFSIDILIDLLCGAIRYLSQSEIGLLAAESGPGKLPRKSLTAENRVFSRSLLRVRRCPSLCWRLRPSASALYSLLALPQVGSTLDHSKCAERKCTVHNVNYDTYETVHTTDCGGCEGCQHVPVNVGDVVEIIKRGGIPLVSLVEDFKGHVTARIIKRTAKHRYTAVSHVWSGGLGNFKSNSLPNCQLKRLRTLLRGISEHTPELFNTLVPFPSSSQTAMSALDLLLQTSRKTSAHLFWMDSLCVPVGDELEGYRQDAIRSMGEIYAAAVNVIVLDPDLQQISVKSNRVDLSSLQSYLNCSPWMARSWTLQEGALALDVLLVFKDVILSSRQLLAEFRREFPTIPLLPRHGLDVPWQRILDFDSAKYKAYSITDYKLDRFYSAWNGLAVRSTSQQKDVPGIFAVLLGLSPKEILSFPGVDGMKAVIRAQEYIPLSVLYAGTTEIGGKEDSHWIPSLPGMDTSCPLDPSCGTLQVTDDGFIVKDPGYRLSALIAESAPLVSLISRKIHLQDQSGREDLWVHLEPFHGTMNLAGAGKLFFMFSRVPGIGRNGMPGAFFRTNDSGDENVSLSYQCGMTVFLSQPDPISYQLIKARQYVQSGSLKHEILIRADIKSWPALQWFRQNSFNLAAIYNDYLMVWFFSGGIAWILTWLGGAGHIIGERMWPNLSKAPFIVSGALRFICWLVDIPLWFFDLHDFLHTEWAASFSESRATIPGQGASRPSSPFSWYMGANRLSIIAAIALLVFWAFLHLDWMVLCGACLVCEILLRFALAPFVRRCIVTPLFEPPAKWYETDTGAAKGLVTFTPGF